MKREGSIFHKTCDHGEHCPAKPQAERVLRLYAARDDVAAGRGEALLQHLHKGGCEEWQIHGDDNIEFVVGYR
jgi:hypothetical protein